MLQSAFVVLLLHCNGLAEIVILVFLEKLQVF